MYKTTEFATGVSDCHNLIGTLINVNVLEIEKRKIQYRSFRTLDANALNDDLQKVELLSCVDENEKCNIDAVYDKFETGIVSIFYKHAPIKQACVREKQLPYMKRK